MLLLVLSNIRTPIEESQEESKARILKLQDELIEIKGQRDILNRDLLTREEQLSDVKDRIARLKGDLSSLRGQYAASKKDSEAANHIEGQLVAAQEKLTDEMKRLYAGAEFTFVRRWKLNSTAAEFIGVPSWNFTFGRSLNVYVLPSGEIVHDVARAPSICVESGL